MSHTIWESPSYPSRFSGAAGIFLLPYLDEFTPLALAVSPSKTVRYRYFISNPAEDARESFLPDPHIAGAGCHWTKGLRPTKGVNCFQLPRELEKPTTALLIVVPYQRGMRILDSLVVCHMDSVRGDVGLLEVRPLVRLFGIVSPAVGVLG